MLTVGSFLLTAELSYLQLTISFFTYSWSFIAYSFSVFAYSWSFFAYSGRVHLIRAKLNCKQKSLTASTKAPTVSKKASPVIFWEKARLCKSLHLAQFVPLGLSPQALPEKASLGAILGVGWKPTKGGIFSVPISVATIHFSPFTCCFRVHSQTFSATRTPNS